MTPSEALQKAIYDHLIADADVNAIVGGRIYDGRPSETEFPCITFGPSDFVRDDEGTGEIDGRVETLQIDCWARDNARLRPAKMLVDAVSKALHRAQLDLGEVALIFLEVRFVRTLMDPDGRTAHGVVTIEAALEE